LDTLERSKSEHATPNDDDDAALKERIRLLEQRERQIADPEEQLDAETEVDMAREMRMEEWQNQLE
jgi:hypothetical protein